MRVPKGYSYRPGRSQSPDTEWIFVPVDLGVPMAGPPGAAVQRDVRGRAEGLDVVDDGRMARGSRCSTGKGGRMRGVPRLPSSDSISDDSSPHT